MASKIKKAIQKNIFLIKIVLFVVIFAVEVLLMKLFIDTAHTRSFDYLSFNFQSTELPLYFLLILLIVAKGKIFYLKSGFEKKGYFYLIPHIASMVGFYFYTIFIISNPDAISSNVLFFKITWYGLVLLAILLLGLFLFPFGEIKRFFIDLRKELAISLVLSILFLYLFEKMAPLLYNIGMLAANMAIGSLKGVCNSLVVYTEPMLRLRYGVNRVSYSPLCSGVIGYVFFILFYLLYSIVNYKNLNKIRAAIVFFIGFVFFFLMDYIRNFLSLYVWTLNPHVGVQLFHSNVRPLYYTLNLLIIYFVFRKWLTKEKTSKKNIKKRKNK